jgi:hypothetical protein
MWTEGQEMEQAGEQEAATAMELIYDQQGDSAAVLTNGEIGPENTADVQEQDSDRIVRYDADGRIIEYQFFNVRRYGVRLNDLADRDELAALFRAAGISERDWSQPVVVTAIRRRRRRDAAAG